MRSLSNNIEKRKQKQLHVEGIQTESGTQDTPTSGHSGRTTYEIEMNQRDYLVQYFHNHYSFDSISQFKQKIKIVHTSFCSKYYLRITFSLLVSIQQLGPIVNNILIYIIPYIKRKTT